MNRRKFLSILGIGAASAVTMPNALILNAAGLLENPERELWLPGQKTIIDFGATKKILPATDAQVRAQAARTLLQSGMLDVLDSRSRQQLRRDAERQLAGPRSARLDMRGTDGLIKSFHYQDDKLVGTYTEADLKLLNAPLWFPEYPGTRPARPGEYRPPTGETKREIDAWIAARKRENEHHG